MDMSKLFEDKYKSSILQQQITKLVEKMAELKRENYYDMIKVDRRKDEINQIEFALTELGIPLTEIPMEDEF